MMTDPPIDKLIKKTTCRYALVMGVTARAKHLITSEPEKLEQSKMKPLTLAAKEIYEGKVIIK